MLWLLMSDLYNNKKLNYLCSFAVAMWKGGFALKNLGPKMVKFTTSHIDQIIQLQVRMFFMDMPSNSRLWKQNFISHCRHDFKANGIHNSLRAKFSFSFIALHCKRRLCIETE